MDTGGFSRRRAHRRCTFINRRYLIPSLGHLLRLHFQVQLFQSNQAFEI